MHYFNCDRWCRCFIGKKTSWMWHCYIWHVFDFFRAKQVTHPNTLLNTMLHKMLLVCEIWSWTRAAIWLEELFIPGSLINAAYCTVPYFPHCVIFLSHLVLSSVHMCVLTVLATSVSCLFCLDMFSLLFLSRLSCHPLLSLQSQGKLYDCEKVRNHRHVCPVVLLLHASSCRPCCRVNVDVHFLHSWCLKSTEYWIIQRRKQCVWHRDALQYVYTCEQYGKGHWMCFQATIIHDV